MLEDGTELPADLVVYATGYGSMNGWAADLISQEVADTVGKVWGLGSDTTKDPGPWEGEQRNMWKPTQQEALWFHGGNLHQSRHYSLYLALQLKARARGHRHPGLRACRRCTTRPDAPRRPGGALAWLWPMPAGMPGSGRCLQVSRPNACRDRPLASRPRTAPRPAHRDTAPPVAGARGPASGRLGCVPELPEVELARTTIERAALRRRIADVDDADSYECRPTPRGDPRRPGRTIDDRRVPTRQGDVVRDLRRRPVAAPGPVLGLHLGMSGRIVVSGRDGDTDEGGDRITGSGSAAEQDARKPEWDRFTLVFADGGALRLFDKRRLGRVRLDPDLAALGPDAEQVGVAEFRERVGRGSTAVKARLLDQSVVAGVGNLLADETLWQAAARPAAPRRRARPRRAHRPAPGAAPRHPRGDPARRRPHRRGDRRPVEGRPLPALRRRDGPRHGRRPDDVLVPGRAAPELSGRRAVGAA